MVMGETAEALADTQAATSSTSGIGVGNVHTHKGEDTKAKKDTLIFFYTAVNNFFY